ncbi:hypothetical protein HDU80_001749 [Chytriomyces hyalinus]|nr:hypothetical protein HDU80_001749 [Chytriomyces hyalinus]
MSVDALAAMRFHGAAQYRGTTCASNPVAVVLDRTLSTCGAAKPSNTTNGACLLAGTHRSTQPVECVDNNANGAMEAVPHLQLLTSATRGCNFFSNKEPAEHKLLTLVRLGVCVNVFESARMDATLPSSQKSVAAVIVRLNSSIAAPDSSNQNNNKQSLFVSQFSDQNCASSSLVNTYPLGVSNGECTFFHQSGVSSSALLANNYGATALTLHSSVSSCSANGPNNPVSFHYSFAQSKCTPTPANTCIPAAPVDETSTPTSHYSASSMHASIACIPHFQQTAHLDFLKSSRPAWAVPSQNRDYLYMHTFLDNACTALRAAHIVKLGACVPNHVHVARTGANQTVFPAWVTRNDDDASLSDEDDFKGEPYWTQNTQQESSKTPVSYRLHLDDTATGVVVYKTEFTDTQCMDPVSIPIKQVVVGRVNVGCVGRVLLQWNSADAFSSVGASAPTPGIQVNQKDQDFSVKTGIIVGTTVFFSVIVLGTFIAFAYFSRKDNLARRAKVWEERQQLAATTTTTNCHAPCDTPPKSFWRQQRWWWNWIGKRGKHHNGTEGDAMHLGDGVL